jgi:hypothetical protein
MAMTREEKNARRRLLDQDPFHHALTLRTQRRWRKANAARLAKMRRERYANDPEYREREKANGRRWYEANVEKKKAAWKKWAEKNRERLRERDRLRSGTEKEKARRAKMIADRRERMKNDPEYAAKVREQKRLAYHRNKAKPSGLAWMHRNIWEPKWREVVSGGPDRVAAYLKRAKPRTRHYFGIWYGKYRREFGMGDWRLMSSGELKNEARFALSHGGDSSPHVETEGEVADGD